MAAYINLEYLKGTPRQRGGGLGALANKISRTAFPIFWKNILPTAKKLEKNALKAAPPELGEVIAGRSLIKKANKRAAEKNLDKRARRRETEGKESKKATNEPSH